MIKSLVSYTSCFYKHKVTTPNYHIYTYPQGCSSNYSIKQGDFKDAISISCCNLLINGFVYGISDGEYWSDGINGRIRCDGLDETIDTSTYIVSFTDIDTFKNQLKELGIRLIKI